eukprot:m.340802 g.340802  ORF g.340802 m.340802 type:complete len:93 (+) comp19551_c0_seq1:106-384(+)
MPRGRQAALILRNGRPPKLSRRAAGQGSSCQTELAALMGCWQNHEFNDTQCQAQARAYLNCAAQQMKKQTSSTSQKEAKAAFYEALKLHNPK